MLTVVAVGTWDPTSPFHTLKDDAFTQAMRVGVFSNFGRSLLPTLFHTADPLCHMLNKSSAAYKTTIPHLLSQGNPNSTWTMIAGAAGELGAGGVTALTQGALYSMANVASRELAQTNVRFNEVFLNLRVDFDGPDSVRPEEFSYNYEQLLQNKSINESRISIKSRSDIADLKWEAKIQERSRRQD